MNFNNISSSNNQTTTQSSIINDSSNTSTATNSSTTISISSSSTNNNKNNISNNDNNNSASTTNNNNSISANNNSTSDQSKPKRNPYCSRCRNHGQIAQVKGHKRHCEYRDCQCDGCKLVECRQIVSAAQIKRRRYQKQDEECGRRIEISPPVLARNLNDPASLIAKHVGLHHHQQHPNHQQHQQNKQIIAAATAATSSHLFHMPTIPTTLLSTTQAAAIPASYEAAAVAMHHQQHHHLHQVQPAATTLPAAAAGATAPVHSVHSPQNLLNLVLQLDGAFGPLITYAWLRAERFDLAKIRDTIELSKIPFKELLQTTSHPHMF